MPMPAITPALRPGDFGGGDVDEADAPVIWADVEPVGFVVVDAGELLIEDVGVEPGELMCRKIY